MNAVSNCTDVLSVFLGFINLLGVKPKGFHGVRIQQQVKSQPVLADEADQTL